jgi:hypothetical protein
MAEEQSGACNGKEGSPRGGRATDGERDVVKATKWFLAVVGKECTTTQRKRVL